MKSFEDVVKGFQTTPFLFVGSGLSQRYCGLPDWESLLRVFCKRLSEDEFFYARYRNEAIEKLKTDQDSDLLPEMASLIERDFNKRWFSDCSFRNVEGNWKKSAFRTSPFKCEVAQYLHDKMCLSKEKSFEIDKLKDISKKNITGIITTNYDSFLPDITGFKTYVGQNDLLFSNLQNWGEIYQIHGSLEDPDSLVLTNSDYLKFEENEDYLAAKLMTIFMEYPIVFMGYSLTDRNIVKLLESISKCMSEDELDRLREHLIYIEWKEGENQLDTSTAHIRLGKNVIELTRVRTDNFLAVYEALARKKATLPVGVLRMFREEFYAYALTNTPTSHIQVATFNTDGLGEDDLVIGIGRQDDFSTLGYQGVKSENWYNHVLLWNQGFNSRMLLKNTYPSIHVNNQALPLCRLFADAGDLDCQARNDIPKSFDDVVYGNRKDRKESIIRKYPKDMPKHTVHDIIESFNGNFPKTVSTLCLLVESEIDVNELEIFLEKNIGRSDWPSTSKSNFRKLIRIWDYLKYGKKIKRSSNFDNPSFKESCQQPPVQV